MQGKANDHMKKLIAAIAFLAVISAGALAHAGVEAFSDDSSDYHMYVSEEDGFAEQVFYGIVEGDVKSADVEWTDVYFALYDGVEVTEFNLDVTGCELLHEVGSGHAFRCFGQAFDTEVTSIQDKIGLYYFDEAYVKFEVDGVESDLILSRALWYDAAGVSHDDDDGDLVPDQFDNCLSDKNFEQDDDDGDGNGDACDACPGVEDAGVDTDMDGLDDACDPCPLIPYVEECAGSSSSSSTSSGGSSNIYGGGSDYDEEGYDFDIEEQASGLVSSGSSEGASAGCALAQSQGQVSYLGLILIGIGFLQIASIRRK